MGGLVIQELRILVTDFPHLTANFKQFWTSFAGQPFIQRLGLEAYVDLSSLSERMGDQAGHGVTLAMEALKTFAEGSAHFGLVLIFALLMLASRNQIRTSVEQIAESHSTHSGTRGSAIDEIVDLIEKFLMARIGIAVGVAVLDFIILKLFGTNYGTLLACFLGLSTLIPVVGFLLGILPSIGVALVMGHSFARVGLMTLLLYLVSSIEAHFVTPKYLGRQLNLNLLSTFVGLFAGELLWGIWGLLLSVPILGILRILLSRIPTLKPLASLLAEERSNS